MIQLNYRDTRPFYVQIKENLRQMMVSKAIDTGEKLPSVRELATALAINPNTIQRAYHELENEGYIYTVSGKGSFVASGLHIQKARAAELLGQFDILVKELLFLSISPEELSNRIEKLKEGGSLE